LSDGRDLQRPAPGDAFSDIESINSKNRAKLDSGLLVGARRSRHYVQHYLPTVLILVLVWIVWLVAYFFGGISVTITIGNSNAVRLGRGSPFPKEERHLSNSPSLPLQNIHSKRSSANFLTSAPNSKGKTVPVSWDRREVYREIYPLLRNLMGRRPGSPSGSSSYSAKECAKTLQDVASLINSQLQKGDMRTQPHSKGKLWQGTFTGEGIVFSTEPSRDQMLLVASTVTHLRTTLQVQIPVEIFVGSFDGPFTSTWSIPEKWRLAHKLLSGTPGVRLRTFGYELQSKLPNRNRFLWKLLAIILSSFDRVLYMDTDSFPLREPSFLFKKMLQSGVSGLFWSDIWPLYRQAPLWSQIRGGIPETGNGLSQESGQLVIRKVGGGTAALLLALYMNMWPDHFYPHVYCRRQVRPGECDPSRLGHGAGDKDTFFVAWHIMGERYLFMPPPASFGVAKDNSEPCSFSQLQLGPDGEPAFLHHNLRKLAKGRTDATRVGQALAPGILAAPKPHVDGVVCQRGQWGQAAASGALSARADPELSPDNDIGQNCIRLPRAETADCDKMFSVDFLPSIKQTLFHMSSQEADLI